jgi:hypothetical protein
MKEKTCLKFIIKASRYKQFTSLTGFSREAKLMKFNKKQN